MRSGQSVAADGILQASEQAIEDGTWSWKQWLDGRSFALVLSGSGAGEDGAGPATDAGARVTVWGAGWITRTPGWP